MILTMANGTRDGVEVSILIFGLTDENIHRLKEGMPIHTDGRRLGLPTVDVVIMAGRSDEAIRRDVESTVRQSGGSIDQLTAPPPESQAHEELVDLVTEGARQLGARIVYVPTPDAQGVIHCADCDEGIEKTDHGYWTHTDPHTEHGCRYGQGCAHPHEPYYEIARPQPTTQGEEQ